MPVVIPPIGLTPLGFHSTTETGALAAPPVIAAEYLDYSSGDLASVIASRDPIDAQVFEALTRVRFSGAAVTTTGARFVDVEKLTDDAEDLIRAHATNALATLVARGDIAVDRVEVEIGDDWFEVTVVYFNRRTRSATPLTATVRKPFGAVYAAT